MLFLIIAIVSLILQFFLPWWIIAPVAFGISMWIGRSGKQAFGSAFLAIFLLWIIMGLIHTLPNENILANRIGTMLKLPETSFNWVIVLLVSGITGGLASGFSALSGFYFREAIKKS
ncbi:MAG: hypothetical protein WC220_01155 [Pedobacter sp.]|jgi:hypothetical protein